MTKIKTDKSGTEKLFVLFDDGDKLWADSDDRVQKLEMKHNQTKSQTRKRIGSDLKSTSSISSRK